MEQMKPLLKWAGGKRHIAETLEAHLPADWSSGTYFEPFLGGAAFFLHLQHNKARLSDVNQWLIRFYINVRDNPEELMQLIVNYASHFDGLEKDDKKLYFYELRENFNKHVQSTDSSALLYVLNKLCFNGLYRENSRGLFNVPFGNKSRFPEFNPTDFLEVSEKLSNTVIEVNDFESAVENARAGDFVYLDPPYIPIDVTSSFTSYSSGGFSLDDQRRLADLMEKLRERGVNALLSNSSTAVTAEIYKSMKQVKIYAPRMVSAKTSGRGAIEELLIMNY